MVTFAAFNASRSSAARAAGLRMDTVAAQVVTRADDEMRRYLDLLRGVTGLWMASDDVTAEEFRDYVETIDIGQRYPGALAVAVVERDDVGSPLASPIVRSAEPSPAPLLTPGRPVSEIPGLASTIERATARSGPALSAIVALDGDPTGPHFYVSKPLTTDVGAGSVTVLVDADTFLSGLARDQSDELGISLVELDADPTGAVPLAVGSTTATDAVRVVPIDMLDRRWELTVASAATMMTASERMQPWIVLGTGLALTFVVTLLTLVQGSARSRSLTLLERAERSELRSERLLEIAPVAIVELAYTGDVLRWNDAAAELFGRSSDEVVGRRLDVAVEADGATVALLDLVGDQPPTGVIHADGTRRVVVHRTNGDAVERRKVVVFCASSDERDERRLVVLVDETDHTDLLQRLADSQKLDLVGRLAGGVAHDFNNFLTAIRGYVELVLADDSLATGHRTALRQSVAASERAAAVVAQLLAVSRHEVSNPEVVDVGRHVTAPDSLLRTVISSEVDLDVEVSGDVAPTVRIDPTQLEQVLLNLVINARDAVGGRGRIALSVCADAAHVTISVADDGHGMTPSVRDRIFEPFFSTKGPTGGTGLGLPTVKSIVTGAGGQLAVETAEADGTTFTITLPRVDEAAPRPPSGDEPPAAGASRTGVVLVVEDEPAVRMLITKILTADGHRVLQASDAASALDQVASRRRDSADGSAPPLSLVLTDVVLPGTSGPELVEQLRSAGERARVIFMSGYAHGTLTDDGELPEGTRFLGKPFSADELRRAIDAALTG